MLDRLKHTFGFISLIAVYAPTETSELEEKEMFYAKIDSVVEQCPSRDTLIVLGDFNAVTGTERAGYEFCVAPQDWRQECQQLIPSELCKVQKTENWRLLVPKTRTSPLDMVQQCWRRG